MTLTFGSLFSGIGGIDLGLERAGMECRWQVEIEPYCQAVLNTHWPHVPLYGDVRELSGSTLEAVDAICGGFPCQPVSIAGRRKGQGDSRWLWPEYARLVDELRPRYFIVENVPGIYSLGGTEVVADLAAMGYDAEWGSFPAEAFGAPHKRERFVLVAHTHSAGLERRGGQRDMGTTGQEKSLGRGGEHGGAEKVADPDRPLGNTTRTTGETIQGSGSIKRSGRRGRLLRRPRSWDEHWRYDPADFPESGVGRVAYGVSNRVDRIRSLGNSVVPQVFEHVGRLIMEDAEKRGYLGD